MPPASRKFDQAYYDRFYGNSRTRVATEREFQRVGRFVRGYLDLLEIEVRSVLDLGCGVGHWQRVVKKHFPAAQYRGVEVSAYLCREHGWARGSIVDFDGPGADLVVCHGVLQYLGARDARRAIRNLARLVNGALYLEVLTREDWDENVDKSVTDGDVYLRPVAFYRKELSRLFRSCGGGVFVPCDSPVVLYELERGLD